MLSPGGGGFECPVLSQLPAASALGLPLPIAEPITSWPSATIPHPSTSPRTPCFPRASVSTLVQWTQLYTTGKSLSLHSYPLRPYEILKELSLGQIQIPAPQVPPILHSDSPNLCLCAPSS